MRLLVPDEPDTVENNVQYRALGRSFYRCLKEFDLADLHSQVHDEAVDLIENILKVLNDPDLDDAHCLDELCCSTSAGSAWPLRAMKSAF